MSKGLLRGAVAAGVLVWALATAASGDSVVNLRLGHAGRTTTHSTDFESFITNLGFRDRYQLFVGANDLPKSFRGTPVFSTDPNGNNPVPLTLEWDGGATGDLTIAAPEGYRSYVKKGVSSGVALPNLVPGVTYVCTIGGASLSVTPSRVPPRQIVDTIWNMRDLGGWIGLGGRRVRYGKLFRSSAFNYVRKGRDYVQERPQIRETCVGELGIRTDLDLRREADELVGMTQSPLGADVTWICREARNYSLGANVGPVAVAIDPANWPLDFHCHGGKDRTGSVSVILLALLGVGEDDLFREYEASGASTGGGFHKKVLAMLQMAKSAYPGMPLHMAIENTLIAAKGSTITHEKVEAFRAAMLEDVSAPLPND